MLCDTGVEFAQRTGNITVVSQFQKKQTIRLGTKLPLNLKKMKLLYFVVLFFFSINTQAQDVYKTPSGKKYHLENCSMVKNVSEKITVEQAADIGLEACKVCKPAVLPIPQNLVDKAKGQNKTVQCNGLTKKGSRCRHMTRIADGYCFQHRQK